MKFFVAINSPFSFSHDFPKETKGKYGRFEMNYYPSDNLDQVETQISNVLRDMIEHDPRLQGSLDVTKNKVLTLILCASESQSMQQQGVLSLQDNTNFFTIIGTLLGPENLLIKVTLALHYQPPPLGHEILSCETSTHNVMTTKDMTVKVNSLEICKDNAVTFPNASIYETFLGTTSNPVPVQATLTVEVTINTRFARSPAKRGSQELYAKMLHDELHCDVTITAENGSQTKCHKSVLSASSPVFEAMFRTDMEESKSHNIELPDTSEEAVKAFLKFIYYNMDDGETDKDCGIAFELLNAAHKYDVTPDLETEMTNLILSKPIQWFDVCVGVKIFLFSRNIPNNGNELKQKAIKVLTANSASLLESKAFNEMFKKNPTAAMELCRFAFAGLSRK